MGMRSAVETFCPAGRLLLSVEHPTLAEARTAYEAEAAAMPESFTGLRWAGSLIARTKPLADLHARRLEASMFDVLHGRDPHGFGLLPWTHPEAAEAWGSYVPRRQPARRRW